MKNSIKANVKSNFMSYIFCIGILFVVVLPISCINTSAATINAVATSTKEICRDMSWKNLIENKFTKGESYKSKSIYTVPSMDRTINKYIAFTSQKTQNLNKYITNLTATKFIKSTCIQIKSAVPAVINPRTNNDTVLFISLSVLFAIFILGQLYCKENEIKILLRRKEFHEKINYFKYKTKEKINLFNKQILSMLEEDTKKDSLANIVIHNKAKNKKRYNRINIGSFLIYINANICVGIKNIETVVNRAYNGVNIMKRGYKPKFACVLDTS